MTLSGWGRFPALAATVHAPRDIDALRRLVTAQPALIARGNGRAYGDSAVNAAATVHMRHFNRMVSFDDTTGQLVAQAGVLLADIIDAFLPKGWFPKVTPGTKFVTLGGMIAADVHGKNHHKTGSFRSCLDWVEVMMPDGTLRQCSATRDQELFDNTVGGMGLTGVVVRAALTLQPVQTAWITQTTRPLPDLDATLAAFDDCDDATYSVAWIDCLARGDALGRSLLMCGEHTLAADLPDARAAFAVPKKRRLTVPFDVPAFALNRLTVKAFNAAYYRAGQRRKSAELVDWDSYFYPLDAILGWNRIYGRKGFAQFQCVLPLHSAQAGLTALLHEISKAGAGSFLAVLKRLGAQDSAFSFPMEGYTLALDFPVSPKTLGLLTRLDQIALAHQGRFYLAKDSRMTAATLRASDPRAAVFHDMRVAHDFQKSFRSQQSERLGL